MPAPRSQVLMFVEVCETTRHSHAGDRATAAASSRD
jgi:hypothetical protein